MARQIRFLVLGTAVFLMACSPVKLSQTPTVDSSVGNTPEGSIPACEIDIPQVQLDGNVNAFQFMDSFGVTFGYDPTGSNTVTGVSASVTVSTAQMDLTMLGSDPLSHVLIASTDVGSNQTSTTINAEVDFSQFAITPSLFFQTPLAKVTANGLTLGVSGIVSQLSSTPWIGRVLQQPNPNTVIVNAGSLAGVQVGDQFNVFNVEHYWAGTPCASAYYGSQHDSTTPVVTIKITSVSDGTSFGQVVTSDQYQTLRLGAEVLVGTLASSGKGSSTRVLKKKAKIGVINSENFDLPGGGTFDFGNAMNSQILDVVEPAGFVM